MRYDLRMSTMPLKLTLSSLILNILVRTKSKIQVHASLWVSDCRHKKYSKASLQTVISLY